MPATLVILCPDCGRNITADVAQIVAEEGPMELEESFECSSCDAELIVTSIDPLELEVLEDEDEEFEGDGDDEEEEGEDEDDEEYSDDDDEDDEGEY